MRIKEKLSEKLDNEKIRLCERMTPPGQTVTEQVGGNKSSAMTIEGGFQGCASRTGSIA